MKTVEEWLRSIRNKQIRRKALDNMISGDRTVDSLHLAIDRGFSWGGTPEGSGYWIKIFERAANGHLETKNGAYYEHKRKLNI